MQVEKLAPFFTPLWKFNIGSNFDVEIAACYALQERLPTRAKSNIGGYQSPNVIFDEEFPELYAKITPILAAIASNAELNLSVRNAWVNINKTHDSNQSHMHPNAALSVVVYLQVGVDTGEIVFENPTISGAFPVDHSTSHFSGTYSVLPSVGDVLVFPAYLRHFVHQNLSSEDRISIALNMA